MDMCGGLSPQVSFDALLSTGYASDVTDIATKPSATPEPGKGPVVQRLFGAISKRYDLANHIFSGGLDFLWRRRAAKIVHSWAPKRVLDMATGSGDLALAIAKKCPNATIVGADFCQPMLDLARRKGLTNLVLADALNLPFATGEFDVVTVAFGLRNMENWERALAEMARVLRTGGHLLVLDFSVPRAPLRGLYRLYLHRIVPFLAGLLTGERGAYEYLGASIEEFPQGEAMNQLIARAGFDETQSQPLTGGIVTLYTARRL